jgi:hypothetical protein
MLMSVLLVISALKEQQSLKNVLKDTIALM